MMLNSKSLSVVTLVIVVVSLLSGCSRGVASTIQSLPTRESTPYGVTYCDIAPAEDLCLEGFGLDFDERLLVLLKANDRFFADITVRADGPEGEIVFECQQSGNILENVYCLGEPFPEGQLIKMNIYSNSNDRLVAVGVFDVVYETLPIRDVTFMAEITPVPTVEPIATSPSYPNPPSAP